jgi:hypothetical protein
LELLRFSFGKRYFFISPYASTTYINSFTLNTKGPNLFKCAKTISQEFIRLLTPFSPASYRTRIQNSFKTDLLKCPHCGNELILYQIWHPKHGFIYDIYTDENWKETDDLSMTDVVEEENAKQQSTGQDNQLYLFGMQPSV